LACSNSSTGLRTSSRGELFRGAADCFAAREAAKQLALFVPGMGYF
jgi:hypothetical protein